MNIAAFEGLTPLEIFRKLAPEFAAVPDEVVQGYIELASQATGKNLPTLLCFAR